MLFDPIRHEPLQVRAWDASAAQAMIERIVGETEAARGDDGVWPAHPLDAEGDDRGPYFNLYLGAAGVAWALHDLHAAGAVHLARPQPEGVDAWLPRNRRWLDATGSGERDAASYLMGDTGLLLLGYRLRPDGRQADRLAALIESNLEHPAQELMWGVPGTMLVALFLHDQTGEQRWTDLFRRGARALAAALHHAPAYACSYWMQDLHGYRFAFLGGVHGFAATAATLIRGRHLFDAGEWDEWQRCIVGTMRATALREGGLANWLPGLDLPADPARPQKRLMQFCHGAPGIVVCLADLPGTDLDDLLVAGGEAVWAAGPLAKGSNLCHGTGGNGYAFLRLFERTGDERWLARARAFAMHGMAQTLRDAHAHGRMRYSLWTGDPGFALYLADCIRGAGRFPTLEKFFATAQ